MSKLVIVESPAKAKTIEKYLSELGNYKVVASVGHVRDLPKSNKKAIDIEAGFVPTYEISKGKEHVVADIKSLAKKADEILLATDPDREGESIAWHIGEACGFTNSKSKKANPKPVRRIVFNEITKEAVQEAINNPRDIDMNLKEAQEARRVLDRLFGYELSGLIWKKVRYGLSAGRVQSPALRILMEREREIRAFIPETFWTISAELKKDKEKFQVNCTQEPRDKKVVDDILKKGQKGTWIVKDVKETQAKRSPKAPFITSTLQQTASTRLGFSPSRTMQIAQKLYEAGHITYMRTDSTNLSQNALGQIKSVVTKEFGVDHFSPRNYGKASKNAQEAHEAIRPSNIGKLSAGNTDEQKRLYKMIWSRTVASQMIDAQMLRTRVLTNIKTNDIPDFSVSGQRILKEGWLKADPAARGEETEVPHIKASDILDLISIDSEEKQTQPPSRYTEAGLIKELEKRGIGRPSTYAAIIRTLNEREYVTKEGKTLTPTDTGDVVSSFVEQNFENYISDSFTADMEDKLDEVAEGTNKYLKVLKDFYGPFLKAVKEKESIDKLTTLGEADEKHKCPKCGALMQIKLGRGGKFISCSKYPECDGALTIEGHELKPDEPIGIYPETGENIFVLTGRFGPYVQVGELKKGSKEKPKRASIPKEKNPTEVTQEDALKYLSLPRVVGVHPETQKDITASIGRFGPYIVHEADFRSLKTDSVYDITLDRALEILEEEKKKRAGRKKK